MVHPPVLQLPRPEPPESRALLCSTPEPRSGFQRLDFSNIEAPRLTHYLFRFPAKFHPPVAHSLIRSYTSQGQTVLDPFCGSGTLLLAASAEGRSAIGSDVDPVAVFVSKVKSHRFGLGHLRASWALLRRRMEMVARSDKEYSVLSTTDISYDRYVRVVAAEQLWVPDIPNFFHWFRHYVIIDLARILREIDDANIPNTHRSLFKLIFASIIRKASNADPIPVSGLEVTSHMKQLDANGRLINPPELFVKAAESALTAVESYFTNTTRQSRISVLQADVTSLKSKLRRQVDAVITSPPYHNAVDYYRRHKLEMFWLKFTKTQEDRLDLLPKYIGRSNVRQRDPLLQRRDELGFLSGQWYEKIKVVSTRRADAFVHYMISMKDAFSQIARVVRPGAPVAFVLGNSAWNGERLPTAELFLEIAGDSFRLEKKLWYPVKNRYMSYGRRNGADINEEYVLVFRRNEQ